VPGGADSAPAVVADRAFAKEVLTALNATRATKSRAKVSRSAQLARAAQRHVSSMARLGFFSHSSADGSGPGSRITSYYSIGDAGSWAVGEVIFWDDPTTTPQEVVDRWLASSPHRRTILARGWREAGVGVARAENAGGVYGGSDVVIVVVDLGRRA
jgi:uncharacterized protein YkwD